MPFFAMIFDSYYDESGGFVEFDPTVNTLAAARRAAAEYFASANTDDVCLMPATDALLDTSVTIIEFDRVDKFTPNEDAMCVKLFEESAQEAEAEMRNQKEERERAELARLLEKYEKKA